MIALACLVVLGLVYWYGWRSLPQVSGQVAAALGSRATAVRDELGVAHITAASTLDVYFVQGYITSQDRLLQMEIVRRQAAGELAEVFGPPALDSDLEARRLGMRKLAEMHARSMSPEDKALFAAYARGVNHFIESNQGKLPPEYHLLGFDPAPWTVVDSVLVGLQMFRTLSESWRGDLQKAKFLASGDPSKVNFLFPTRVGNEPRLGSNAWAISGKYTKSGKPLLANDPHLLPTIPGIWYQIHLKSPEFDVAGVSLPGLPAVVIGHNSKIAWGMTTLAFDTQDLYIENFQQDRPSQGRDVIRIRGARDREITLLNSRHGPVVVEDSGKPMAVRWTAAEPNTFHFSLTKLNKATNWTEFRDALSNYWGPPHSFLYADVEGNIGYQAAGLLPNRKTFDGDVPLNSPSGESEWDGFIPFDQMPSSWNPDSGMLISGNQNPFPATAPYRVSGQFSATYRARQIQAILESKPSGWDVDGLRVIQKDVYSGFLHYLSREVLTAWKGQGRQNPALAEVGPILEPWNGQMEKGSAAPMVMTLTFEKLRSLIAERAAPEAGKSYAEPISSSVVEALLRSKPAGWFPDYKLLLIQALTQALEAGAKTQGKSVASWDYGKYNEWILRPPVFGRVKGLDWFVNIGPVPMSGSSTTVKVTTPRAAPSMRFVADLANLENSTLVTIAGQSAHILSRHHGDQWKTYYRGDTYPMHFANVTGDTLEFLPLK